MDGFIAMMSGVGEVFLIMLVSGICLYGLYAAWQLFRAVRRSK